MKRLLSGTAGPKRTIPLDMEELRAVAGFAAACAIRVLPVFERDSPDDKRPREAIDAALAFSHGTPRTAALRAVSLGALRAARGTETAAAAHAARSACLAASAAYLHPIASADQVKHILGPAAYALQAAQSIGNGGPQAETLSVTDVMSLVSPTVAAVLSRYPAPPAGGGRTGDLLRTLDAAIRHSPASTNNP